MSASLLVLALAVGSETALVPPQPSAAYQHQFSPKLASDGDDYLAVWFDYRDGDQHVYGTRLGADGAVLDPDGILIAATPRFYMEEPAVVSNGDGYLVAWTDTRGGIWGTRVSTTGAILDGTGFEIAAGGTHPMLASNGTDYLLVWSRYDDHTGETYAVRISAAGAVLDGGGGIRVSGASIRQIATGVASDGHDYLVAWLDDRGGNYGGRIRADGTLVDGDGVLLASPGSDAPLGWDGTHYVLAWRDGAADVRAERITTSLTVLDPGGIGIATSSNGESNPDVASSPAGVLISWDEYPSVGVRAKRLSSAGAVLDASPIVVASDAGQGNFPVPVGASNGSGYFVVWTDMHTGQADVRGNPVTTSGSSPGGLGEIVAPGPEAQTDTVIASNGDEYLVVWNAYRADTGEDIVATRVSGTGEVLDPGGIEIARAPLGQWDPAVASDGTGFLVVWFDAADDTVRGARISASGAVGTPFTIGDNASFLPAVASVGGSYVVAWETGVTIATREITSTGMGTTYTVPTSTAVHFPGLAPNGAGYLLTWTHVSYGIAQRLDATGALVGDAFTVAPDGTWWYWAAGNAWNGTANLVAWASERVWAKRVSPSGTVLDPTGIALGLDGRQPTVASDGVDFLVAWIANGDVLGSEVTASGSADDPTGFAISTSTHDDATPDLAFNAATGGYAIAYATDHRAVVRLLGVLGGGGSPDAGVSDAGTGIDSGTPDADTGSGSPDAGAPPDAGSSSGSGDDHGGCCSASSDAQAPALLVLCVLLALRRQRRAARP